ncbi:MAG: hypothetical protein A2Y94_02460 [Caldithrix sp. RBG_13_44_9]|nr:MAG: hypothetical protein A2Y94_02460 [Caldithrix sp. RBG_13_44_9]
MFTRLAKHKTFEYTPRFYDPIKDEREKTRIHFSRMRQTKRRSRSFIWMLALFIFAVYLLFLLTKMANN